VKTLVIGAGSIGERHARILTELTHEVSFVSSRSDLKLPTYRSISEALKMTPFEYIVVASPTSRHENDLIEIFKNEFKGKGVIEKPIFHKTPQRPVWAKAFNVGYNLRFHPLLQELRKRLSEEKIISAEVYVGQHLSQWRVGRDYRETSSAKKEFGGGVLRDLSHEFDYLIWLLGEWSSVSASGGNRGNLGIETEDCYHLMIDFENGATASVAMNYLDQTPERAIRILTNKGTHHLDLIRGKLGFNAYEILHAGERDETYRSMHQSILREEGIATTFSEGLNVVHFIESAEKANSDRKWINRES
jgi:predicted dehydrogenase